MPTQIEIDQEVWAELQRRAVPLVDTPNTVIRALLGLELNGDRPATAAPNRVSSPRSRRRTSKRRRTGGSRAPAGSLLPESEYELPILRALVEMNRRAPTREVVDRVGEMISDRLTDLDKEVLASGDIRWRNRVQFTRLKMVEDGLLAKNSPRGTWEITDAGVKRAGADSR
jgi:hypothetical protein